MYDDGFVAGGGVNDTLNNDSYRHSLAFQSLPCSELRILCCRDDFFSVNQWIILRV